MPRVNHAAADGPAKRFGVRHASQGSKHSCLSSPPPLSLPPPALSHRRLLQLEPAGHPWVREERERDRRRVCQASRLHDDRVHGLVAFAAATLNLGERLDDVLAEAAADASVLKRDEVLGLEKVVRHCTWGVRTGQARGEDSRPIALRKSTCEGQMAACKRELLSNLGWEERRL
eukprot:364429-Chlamydomonas_euryale.AAC.15